MTSIENENRQLDVIILTLGHLINALYSDLEHERYNENNIQDAIRAISDYQEILNCFRREKMIL